MWCLCDIFLFLLGVRLLGPLIRVCLTLQETPNLLSVVALSFCIAVTMRVAIALHPHQHLILSIFFFVIVSQMEMKWSCRSLFKYYFLRESFPYGPSPLLSITSHLYPSSFYNNVSCLFTHLIRHLLCSPSWMLAPWIH